MHAPPKHHNSASSGVADKFPHRPQPMAPAMPPGMMGGGQAIMPPLGGTPQGVPGGGDMNQAQGV